MLFTMSHVVRNVNLFDVDCACLASISLVAVVASLQTSRIVLDVQNGNTNHLATVIDWPRQPIANFHCCAPGLVSLVLKRRLEKKTSLVSTGSSRRLSVDAVKAEPSAFLASVEQGVQLVRSVDRYTSHETLSRHI